ncbi:MAG: sulfide/dihydroorotate dehydrogenase-like FAD/NAD-binding protein, partial [Bacteroidota bacterium]
MSRIIEKKQLAPNVHICVVEAPAIAQKILPGQFIILIPDEFSERIPITVSDWDKEKGTLTFIFLEVGATTQRLAELNAGDDLYSFTGPLGKPFEIDKYGSVAFIGGCYGIGAIFRAAKAFKEKGNKITCYTEARSKFLLYWNDKLSEVSDEVKFATSDGSLGLKGHAFDSLTADLKNGIKYDLVIAVGCTFMMY